MVLFVKTFQQGESLAPAVRFTSFSPARRTSEVPQPVYFSTMTLLDRGARRGVEESDGPGWKQPCLRPRLETPTICS